MIAATALGFSKQAITQRYSSKGNFILSKYLNNFQKYIYGLLVVWMFYMAFSFYQMYYLQKQYNIHRERDIYPNKTSIVN